MELASNAIRGCIVAPPGRKLVIADLANIEGRGLAYLAGETWKIQAFRDFDAGTGPDLYKLAYARSFNVDPAMATGQKRQIGKVMELGLGYEGGVAAFLTFAAVYRMDLEELADAVHSTAPKDALARAYGMWEWATKKRRTLGLPQNVYVACETLKHAWREAHPATTSLWADMGDAVVKAIVNPGQCFVVRQLKVQRDGAWLRIRLPSGRYLCYINPKVEDGQITYSGVNQYTRQWGRIKTYGGKLVENAVQAWARDVLAYNMREIENAGFEIVLTVHDELLTETDDNKARTVDDLVDFMSQPPPWAEHCPLAAAGFETYRYRKD
jgi:DNA polymerase bacteriophage-type